VRLEALVEVVRAHACNNDSEDEQENGEYSKSGQRLSCRLVVLLAIQVCNVHADKLEQEVAHGDEVDDDNGNHAGNGLAADPPGGEEEEEEGDDQGDSGKGELNGLCTLDDNEELYVKARKKKKSNLSSAM
jgi:hypothetical protein